MTDAAAERVGAELARESVEIFEGIYERCGSEPIDLGQVRCSRIRSGKPVTIDCQSSPGL